MNPDYIPPQIGIPVAIVLWLILFAMILHTRIKLNRALRERPTLKIMNEKGDLVEVQESDIQPRVTISRKPVSNFYDQDAPVQQPVAHRFEPTTRTDIPRPPKGSAS